MEAGRQAEDLPPTGEIRPHMNLRLSASNLHGFNLIAHIKFFEIGNALNPRRVMCADRLVHHIATVCAAPRL
jgi:hypothetical protein